MTFHELRTPMNLQNVPEISTKKRQNDCSDQTSDGTSNGDAHISIQITLT